MCFHGIQCGVPQHPPVAHLHDFVESFEASEPVGHGHDRDAPVPELFPDDVLDPGLGVGVEGGRGLVEEEEAGVVRAVGDNGAGQGEEGLLRQVKRGDEGEGRL